MTWIPDRYRDLLNLLRRGRVDLEIEEEFEHHLVMEIERGVASGLSEAEARRAALERFGDRDRYRRATEAIERSVAAGRRRTERWTLARQEARRAIRSLRRSPSFSLAAIVTLGLGIGATTGIFTLVDHVVLRPLPYPEPDRLVRVFHPVPGVGTNARWNLSAAGFYHFKRQSRTLEDVAVFQTGPLSLAGQAGPEMVQAAMVSASIFNVLRTKPLLGRLLTEQDNVTATRDPSGVIVLSEGFWRRQYGADTTVVGRMITMEGAPVQVVGVVPRTMQLPDAAVDVWVPMGLDPNAPAQNNHTRPAIARLRPGVTAIDAERELKGFISHFVEIFPSAYTESFMRTSGFTASVVPLRDEVIGSAAQVLWLLLGAVVIVLLIAVFNVGNLFLVRAEVQRREVVVRSVLGATRAQVLWHYLAESLVIAGVAGGLGVLLGRVGLAALIRGILASSGPGTLPRLAEVQLGGASVAFAVALSLVVALVFGLVPTFWFSAGTNAVRQSGRGLSPSRRQLFVRRALLAGQIAASVVLTAGAGVMVRTFRNLRHVNPGFDPLGVLAIDVPLPYIRYRTYDRTNEFYEQLVRRVGELPRVTAVGAVWELPIETGDGCTAIGFHDAPEIRGKCLITQVATPGYFDAMGIRVRGHQPTWAENDAKAGSLVVSDALGALVWPGKDPVGRGVDGPNQNGKPPYQIVGVTEGVRLAGLDRPPVVVAYFPMFPMAGTYLWQPPNRLTLVIRTTHTDPTVLVPFVQAIVKALDPEVPLANVRTMDEVVAGSLTRVRITMALLAIAAAVSLVLAVVGLYGVVAYLVTRRTSEIGLRIALGAEAGRISRGVVAESMGFAAVGVGLGLVGTVATTRALGSLLFEVSPVDPVVLAVTTAVLLLVAVFASWLPARRAARIDPMEAMRAE